MNNGALEMQKGSGSVSNPDGRPEGRPLYNGSYRMPLKRVALALVILILGALVTGMGSMPPRINVAVIPIDIAPFQNVEGEEAWYLHRMPGMLRDFADEAIFQIFKGGAQIRQVHPERFEPSQFNKENISAFHEKLLRSGTDFAREFSEDSDPLINVLMTFQLDMPPETVNVDKLDLRILAYYFTREKKDQPLTVWHRTRYLSVVPRNRQDVKEKIENEIANLVQAYRDNPRPE
jgi:hypothetical protein